MLILAKITTGSAGAYAEYLEGKSQAPELGDYYLKGGERTEAPGRWARGADQFGLDQTAPVTTGQLHTLMDVRRPDTGEDLRRAGGSGEAVAAIDATFSAPKSVSAAWALASPTLRAQIETAHEVAIDRALTYATGQVPMLRRRVGQDAVIHEKATGLVATSWRHTTARAVDQQVPDPQLHSHVLLHAAVRRDGKVVAIDSRAWLVHQREVGAAYRTELARELHTLGFGIQRGTGRGGRYFELAGISQQLVDRWSSRHRQVQSAIQQRLTDHTRDLQALVELGGLEAVDAARQLAALEQTGQPSPKQERLMGTITRSGKVPVTTSDLDHEWQHTARRLRVNRERIEALRHHHGPAIEPATDRELLEGLTEFDATFPARDARAIALEQSAGTRIQDALDALKQLRVSHEILVLADGTGTTRQHRGIERTVVAITQRLTQTALPPLPATLAQREADRLEQELATVGGRLSDEQRGAITLACGSQPLVVIQGQAGTGKSTTLNGIARAHHAAGRQILVTSTAALAAERLATELSDHGVTCQAYSTAALHAAIAHHRIDFGRHTTVIHDEAALASTREQLHLLSAVETSGARLIAVGDPEQNQPVGAGGLWGHIEHTTRTSDAHVQLTRNQRAEDPADRRDQALFRTGRFEQALRGYAARDHIHFDTDPRRIEDQALDAAHADRSNGRDTIVIAETSNDHLDALNARAQAIRHQAGQLGSDSLPAPGRPYHLHAGDHVQIRHTITHPDHGPIRNGTPAHITTIDADTKTLALRFADDTEIALARDQITDADLRLAYIQHPFPAQGTTTDTTHLIICDHTTRQGAYVGLTRARDRTDIYTPFDAGHELHKRLALLAETMSRTEPDLPSIRTPLADPMTPTRAGSNITIPPPTSLSEREVHPSRPPAGETPDHTQHSSVQATNPTVLAPSRDEQALEPEPGSEQGRWGAELEAQDREASKPFNKPRRTWPGTRDIDESRVHELEAERQQHSLEPDF